MFDDYDNPWSDKKTVLNKIKKVDEEIKKIIKMAKSYGFKLDTMDYSLPKLKDSIKDTHFTVSSNRNSEEFNSEEELLKKYKIEGYDTVRGIKAPKLKGLMGPFFNGNGKILYETKERYGSYDSCKDVDTYKEVTQELEKETKKLDSLKILKLINIAKKAKDSKFKDSDKLKQLAYKFAQMGNYFDRANSSNSRNILAKEDETKRAEFYKLGLEVYNQLKQEVDYLKNNKKSNSNRDYGFLTETVLLLEDGNKVLAWSKDEKGRLLSKKIDILLYEYKKYTYRDSKAKDSKIKDRDFIIEKVIKSAKDSKGQKFYIVLGKFSDKNEKSYLVTSENPNNKHFVGAGTVEKSLNEAEKTLQMYTKDSCKR